MPTVRCGGRRAGSFQGRAHPTCRPGSSLACGVRSLRGRALDVVPPSGPSRTGGGLGRLLRDLVTPSPSVVEGYDEDDYYGDDGDDEETEEDQAKRRQERYIRDLRKMKPKIKRFLSRLDSALDARSKSASKSAEGKGTGGEGASSFLSFPDFSIFGEGKENFQTLSADRYALVNSIHTDTSTEIAKYKSSLSKGCPVSARRTRSYSRT